MNNKMLLAELKSIENRMDFIDGIHGDYWQDGELCFWCHSKTYNGDVGVVHDLNCLKLQVRLKIARIEYGQRTIK
jgi:hypothetical protein